MGDEDSSARQSVKTYIPEYQKSVWEAHAAELDMSQSEFIRCMVQAGRRGFSPQNEEGAKEPSTPRGDVLKDRVLDILRQADRDWDSLMQPLVAELEAEVEETLEELKESGAVDHGIRGTLTVTTD